MIVLNTFNTSVHPLIIFNGQPIVDRRELIEGFIQKNFPFLKGISLAHVKVKDNGIEFQTLNTETLRPIEDFNVHERKDILQRYNKAVYTVEDYFSNYSDGNENSIKEWHAIFKTIFNHSNNIIYANHQQMVLLWGCEFNNAEENFLPRSEVVFDQAPLPSETPAEEVPVVEAVEETMINDEIKTEPLTQNPIVASQEPQKIIIRSNKSNPRSFINRFFTGLLDFLIRAWWLILLLIFLFLWLNDRFCLTCNEQRASGNEEKNQAQTYLPPRQSISVPINPGDIVFDDDSLFLIADNRINVALKDKQEDFYQFVNALGSSFLNSSRKIIYYNEETARIQIEFNPDSSQNIKEDLRKAVPDYELLIWDESVFATSAQGMNDPYLNRPEISWYLDKIKMERAWSITKGNQAVTVAVVDDGFDLTHPELSSVKIAKKYHVVEQQNQVYGNSTLQHGTHVSTTLLGASNMVGLVGIAPNVSFMPIQIASQSNTYFSNTDVIDGILYALKNKASVINLSLGKQFSPQMANLSETKQQDLIKNYGKDEELFWKELFSMAEKQNTTIVMAAGNDGILSGIDPMQRYENAIIVGAVDQNLKLASFSNYGTYNTIQAPGVQIVSAVPGNNFKPMDGTSMATPIVSGAVALYKSIHPNATNSEIKKKLISSSQQGKVLNVESLLK